MWDKRELEKAYLANKKLKFLFFWGHQKDRNHNVTSTCLSQWYIQNFEVNGIRYPSAEHFMMAEKARLFKDKDALQRILNSKSPAAAKKIGREVKFFNQKIWEENRVKIVIEGNFNKFKQNPTLKEFIVKTRNRILVEASPVDKIWGIGLDKNDAFASIPIKWQGLNLLGFALMEVRSKLIAENEKN